MIEKPMDVYLDPNFVDRSPFFHFKSQVTSVYSSVKKYYEGLSTALKKTQEERVIE